MSKQRNYVLGYLNDSDLRLLRIFSTIVECGGITAAEAELNMANSTLSTHLATLEAHLHMKLCRRGRAGFELTSEGRQVYEAAERMFQSLEEFRRSVQSAQAEPPAQIRVLVPDAMLSSVFDELTPVFRRFVAALPGVFIDIDLASPSHIDQSLIDGKIDIGINSSSRRTHNLRFHDIKEEMVGLYCGVGHPLFTVPERSLSVEKLLQHNFVRAHGYYYPKKIMRALHGTGSAACIPLDGRALLLATGHYLGIMVEDIARPYVERGLLRELMPEVFRYTNRLSIITRADAENPALEKFIDILEQELSPFQASVSPGRARRTGSPRAPRTRINRASL
jgi:LysR family transcriptional regulator, transcriptional activator for bauABCD operon